MATAEERHGVAFTNLDEPLSSEAAATKRDLVNYLEAMAEPLIAHLRDRPLSVIRVVRGQKPFMQKNVPSYAPPWVRTVSMWADSSKREVSYALCNDVKTLLWFGNQRAVEYHPALVRIDHPAAPTHLIMDIDPPSGDDFGAAVVGAQLVQHVLSDAGLRGALKTSGSKGVHVFVPLLEATFEEAAAATRAIAVRAERLDPAVATTAFIKEDRGGKVFIDSTRVGSATVVAAYSPRIRPGMPVSFPVSWDDIDRVTPNDFTMQTVPSLVAEHDPWADQMPPRARLPRELVEEGNSVPVPRAQAMHEGLRRARARRQR